MSQSSKSGKSFALTNVLDRAERNAATNRTFFFVESSVRQVKFKMEKLHQIASLDCISSVRMHHSLQRLFTNIALAAFGRGQCPAKAEPPPTSK